MKKTKTLSKTIFIIIYVAVVVACILLDQLTKLWIFDGLLEGREGNSVDVLGKFLRFYAVYNEGAAFGLGKEEGANIVFFVITLIGTPLFCYLLWRSRTRSVCGQIGFAFIIGGTIGNAIDRAFVHTTGGFFSGAVRDFISFSIFPPIFNVADSFLVIGVVMAILAIVFFDYDGLLPAFRKEKQAKGADTEKEQSQSEEKQTDASHAEQQETASADETAVNDNEKD